MGNVDDLSLEELKEYILEQLGDLGVETDALEIEVEEGPKVTLRGKVDSASGHEMIIRTIMDTADVDNVVDELVVIEDAVVDADSEGSEEDMELLDQDDESMGTEDAFRSVEDGIPYIPPSNPTYQESPGSKKRKKKKNKPARED